MSRPATYLHAPDTHDHMAVLVRAGLAEFWARALPQEDTLPGLLLNEAEQRGAGDPMLPWEIQHERMEHRWPPDDSPLGRLIQRLDLSLPEAFLLTLAGEVETSHAVNLALAQLQAPATTTRPTAHLCVAMLDTLFGPGSLGMQDLPELALVRHHWLTLDGDGPLPLRTLRTHPSLWAVLCGRANGWPDCHVLPPAPAHLLPAATRRELPAIATLLAAGETQGIVIRGHPGSGRGALAAELAALLGLRALAVPPDLWQREPALAAACPYAGWLPVLRPQVGPGEVWRLPETVAGHPLALVLGTDGAVEAGGLLELELGLPTQIERQALWREQLDDPTLTAAAAATALLSGPTISRVAGNVRLLARRAGETPGLSHIAQARWGLGAERLRLLAQPVQRHITADALVVPPLVTEALDNLIERARQREALWRGLGTTLAATPNPGVRALFTGESGTGKTLAASYIATALAAPLYRVDLAAVMNKYIGESEKNLAALLDQAAASDVVLLFDEADSVFGQRTEGKETGERYANMLTNFLLTRIEHHPGIVILTTNSRERIDHAFTRRLDAIVEFPLPGYEERLQLWHSHLGERGPGAHVYRLLASYCDLAGGQLRNVVIAAAVRAGGDRIRAPDLLAGLQAEYRKLGRAMPAKLLTALEAAP
jgi:MoxR-like ATPase